MNPIDEKYQETLIAICKKYNVKELASFGSVNTSQFNTESDLDFLVSFHSKEIGDYTERYFEMAEALEKLFNRPVDLVTDKSLHNPYFINSVNRTKRAIYG